MTAGNIFMSVLLSVWHVIVIIALFFWKYLVIWGSLFIAPYENLETLWIIVPIYISWILAEFFQEKRSTSFGNAISNGGIVLWVGIDWLRYLTRAMGEDTIAFGWETVFKFAVAVLVLTYGVVIIVHGIKGRKYIRFFGRIREVTYVMLMFTPIIYGIVEMDYHFFIAIVLYFPLYYFIVELLDWAIPDPKILNEDEGKKDSSSLDSLSSSSFSSSSLSDSSQNPASPSKSFDTPARKLPDFSSGYGPQMGRKPAPSSFSRPAMNRNPKF